MVMAEQGETINDAWTFISSISFTFFDIAYFSMHYGELAINLRIREKKKVVNAEI